MWQTLDRQAYVVDRPKCLWRHYKIYTFCGTIFQAESTKFKPPNHISQGPNFVVTSNISRITLKLNVLRGLRSSTTGSISSTDNGNCRSVQGGICRLKQWGGRENGGADYRGAEGAEGGPLPRKFWIIEP